MPSRPTGGIEPVDRAAGLDIKAYLLDGRTPTKRFNAVENNSYLLENTNTHTEDIQIYLDGKVIGSFTNKTIIVVINKVVFNATDINKE